MVELNRGSSPVILGLPHTGTHVPDDIRAKLNETGRKLTDTDWHIHELYRGLLPDVDDGARDLPPLLHRRQPRPVGHKPLSRPEHYRLDSVDGFRQPADLDRRQGAGRDGNRRSASLRFHAPYHRALAGRDRAREGQARRRDPLRLPLDPLGLPVPVRGQAAGLQHRHRQRQDLRSADGTRGRAICAAADGYTSVVNGRFNGGWTTRHYGQPGDGVHAIQMELTQATHLKSEALPFDYDVEKAARLRRCSSKSSSELKHLHTSSPARALNLFTGMPATAFDAPCRRNSTDRRIFAGDETMSSPAANPRHNIREIRAPRGEPTQRAFVDDGSAAADADEQPRS